MKILLPVIKTGTGSYFYFRRLAESLKLYTNYQVDIVEFGHFYELIPHLMKIKSLPKYDIVCANSSYAFAFKGVAEKLVVVEMHSIFDVAFLRVCSFFQKIYYRFFIQRYAKASFRCADNIICISESTAQKTRLLVPDKEISIIYCWIDLDWFSPEKNTNPRVRGADETISLIYVGSLSGRKGSAYLPDLARALGSGFVISCVTKDVNKWFESPPNNLILIGALSPEELLDRYRKADFVLTTSLYEGFGYTLLEGLACGKPTVAFDLDVFREVAPPELHCYLASPGDLDSLVNCCKSMVRDLLGGVIDAEKLRAYAENKFDPRRLVLEYERLFVRLLESSAKV